MLSYQNRNSHCGDKTILRPSYLHNGISYTGKMTSLYWIRAQYLAFVTETQNVWHFILDRVILNCHFMSIAGLVKDCDISSALAMEIRQSCTKPSNSYCLRERSEGIDTSKYHDYYVLPMLDNGSLITSIMPCCLQFYLLLLFWQADQIISQVGFCCVHFCCILNPLHAISFRGNIEIHRFILSWGWGWDGVGGWGVLGGGGGG